MRIFVAGASGVIGRRLVPLLIADGHEVAGMTRSPETAGALRAMGARPVVCNVYDAAGLARAIAEFAPDTVIHQLTDLPDDAALIPRYLTRNARIRTEGTRNLIAAAQAASVRRFLAQSIAWTTEGSPEATRAHEGMVLEAGGVVLRYGRLYGPGTYYAVRVPEPPRVHVAEAARRTAGLLRSPSGVVTIAEDARVELSRPRVPQPARRF